MSRHREPYDHRLLNELEIAELQKRLQPPRDVTSYWPTGIFLEDVLVAVVLDDRSGVGSGIAALLNTVTDLEEGMEKP